MRLAAGHARRLDRPGTTRALQACGVAPDRIVAAADDAPQFDSEALWAALAGLDWRGAEVLIVRGDGGRDWLGDELRAHGAQVEPLAAYRRALPAFGPAEHDSLRSACREPARHAWLFSSSEAIDNLSALTALTALTAPALTASAAQAPLTDVDWHAARALATHPRIAARARSLGIGRVVEVRPGFDAVVACLQSFEP